jgi:lysophospholipase L1-like esterase
MSGPARARPLAGVVALGDSITNGEGGMVLGVHCRSWADWLARSLDLPFHGLAEDGARVVDVVTRQLPRVHAPYGLAAVYAGVNDVRQADFDVSAFAAGLAVVLEHAAAHAQGLVVCTIPLDLGRPRAGAAKVAAANARIRRLAARHGAAVADLDGLRGHTLILPDAVHPTALGQLEIADRAARALGIALPSASVEIAHAPRDLARFALLSHVPALGRDWRRRAVEGVARRRSR